MKRHLNRSHPKEFRDVEEKDVPMNKRFAPDCAQKSMLEFVPKSSVKTTVTVSKTDFKASIMKMVAYDGVALIFTFCPSLI